MNSSNTHPSTNWRAIWVLYFSGCTLALHVGKLPAALPLLVDEFNMSLAQAGDLVSVYSLLIALGGLLCGLFVARVGYVLFATVGVGMCLLGSFAGAFSNTVFMLMFTRAVEGLGWILAVVAMPVIMNTLCAESDRPVVLGLWGSFMGVGVGTMLILAPQLQSIGGWRLSWMVPACLSGIGAIAVYCVCRRHRLSLSQLQSKCTDAPQHGSDSRKPALKKVFNTVNIDLRNRGTVAVFICFLCYSFQYVSVTSFVPTLLVQDSDMALSTASILTALVHIPNVIGNIAAGWLINAGIKRSTILVWAAISMGICSLLVLAVPATTVRIPAALAMAGIGGIIPGTLFSTAALLASSTATVGVIIGFMLSGTGIGQLLGPVLTTRVVEWSGHWYTGGMLCLFIGLAGAYFARRLKFIPAIIR